MLTDRRHEWNEMKQGQRFAPKSFFDYAVTHCGDMFNVGDIDLDRCAVCKWATSDGDAHLWCWHSAFVLMTDYALNCDDEDIAWSRWINRSRSKS